ncbi:hypothetical protein EYF80_027922 [Liparis tanakae]|uniref:Uncharacterized protein n=1 Tax=Liparis tanakae TaxID=230148 RepID=A0A4Z2H7Z8_9TELE|nr:hypothetical protein EYF80_027922 [Liparis tanakae]
MAIAQTLRRTSIPLIESLIEPILVIFIDVVAIFEPGSIWRRLPVYFSLEHRCGPPLGLHVVGAFGNLSRDQGSTMQILRRPHDVRNDHKRWLGDARVAGGVGTFGVAGLVGVCGELWRTLCLVDASSRRRCWSAKNSLSRVVVKVRVCLRRRIR